MSNELSPIQKELLDRADTIFKSIAEAATKATEFAKEQIPDIAYQYITMERVYLTFMMVVALAFLLFSLWCFIWGVCKDVCKLGSESGLFLFPTVVFGIIGFLMWINHIKDFIMVWFAPKIFLITHIVNMVKG